MLNRISLTKLNRYLKFKILLNYVFFEYIQARLMIKRTIMIHKLLNHFSWNIYSGIVATLRPEKAKKITHLI